MIAGAGMLRMLERLIRHCFYLDLRMLACFRIGLGSLTLADLVLRASSFRAHYLESGLLPAEEAAWYADSTALLPLHLWFPSDSAQVILFALHGLSAVALIIGFHTRMATLISWLLLQSLHLRNPIILYGADRELATLFFWALFLPLGARWSLDAPQRCRWLGRDRVTGWASAGLLLQVGLIYFTSVFSKNGLTWQQGTAVEVALHIDVYTRDFGRALLSFPLLCQGLTYATLCIECVAPLLLLAGPYRRMRWLGCLLLMAIQIGFLCCFHLGLFPWVSLLAILALLPLRTPPDQPESSSSHLPPNGWLEGSAAVMVCLMLAWHAVMVFQGDSKGRMLGRMPDGLAWLYQTSGLSQSWSMFSPDPPAKDGWLALEYGASERAPVNLLNPSATAIEEKPDAIGTMFPSDRWKEWFLKLQLRGIPWDRTIDYFVEEHRTDNNVPSEVETSHIRLWYFEESYADPTAPPARHLLWERRHPESESGR